METEKNKKSIKEMENIIRNIIFEEIGREDIYKKLKEIDLEETDIANIISRVFEN
jgi:hypothetical protein